MKQVSRSVGCLIGYSLTCCMKVIIMTESRLHSSVGESATLVPQCLKFENNSHIFRIPLQLLKLYLLTVFSR